MKMVALAYGFIWLAVFSYVFLISRRLGKLNGEIFAKEIAIPGRSGAPNWCRRTSPGC